MGPGIRVVGGAGLLLFSPDLFVCRMNCEEISGDGDNDAGIGRGMGIGRTKSAIGKESLGGRSGVINFTLRG